MKNFISVLLGNQSPAVFTAMLFYALLTAFLSLLLHSTTRSVDSSRTPIHFSWNFFFLDNVKRIVTSLVLIYLALRFTPELFGIELTPFWACVIGFSNDKLAQVLKDKTNILTQKTTLPVILAAILISSCGTVNLSKTRGLATYDSTSVTSKAAGKATSSDSLGKTHKRDSSRQRNSHDYERTTTIEVYTVTGQGLVKRTMISEKGSKTRESRSGSEISTETQVSKKNTAFASVQQDTKVSSEKKEVERNKETKGFPGNVFVLSLLLLSVLAVSYLMLRSLFKK